MLPPQNIKHIKARSSPNFQETLGEKSRRLAYWMGYPCNLRMVFSAASTVIIVPKALDEKKSAY